MDIAGVMNVKNEVPYLPKGMSGTVNQLISAAINVSFDKDLVKDFCTIIKYFLFFHLL